MNPPSTCVTFDGEANELAGRLWAALQSQDHSLQALADEGAGEAHGHHLHVKWGRSTRQPFFVCEVVDPRSSEVWEAGVADIGLKQPMAFWRRTSGTAESAPAAWNLATQGSHEPRPFQAKTAPTFLTMLSAFLAGGPPILVEDRSGRALLEDDLSYWRDLAMAQARLVRKAAAEAERLREALDSKAGASAAGPVAHAPRIWILRDLDEWAALNSDRIVVLPRAIAAAKRSNYAEPQNVYAALELLAGTYSAVKRGEADRAAFKSEADALGFSMGGSVDPGVAGEAGEEYFIRWRGRRRFLDQHLRKGSSRDPRYAMRIYWTWDDDEEICVVGWLPSHLTTSRT